MPLITESDYDPVPITELDDMITPCRLRNQITTPVPITDLDDNLVPTTESDYNLIPITDLDDNPVPTTESDYHL